MIKKTLAALAATMAMACISLTHAHPSTPQARKPDAAQAKNEPRASARTLDKEKPAPRPGEGFLIRGRESSSLDKGRPVTNIPADWDLWRK